MHQQVDLYIQSDSLPPPSISDVHEQIRQVYLDYPYPWVIGLQWW